MSKKTDNDHVATKIALRTLAVTSLGAPRPIRVLDAYHGHGRLWESTIAQLPEGWTVKVFGIDKEQRSAGTLRGDNTRIMQSLRLDTFDIIDLDAYGWPVDQLALVAREAPLVPVLTTRIHIALGQIPNRIIDDLGLGHIRQANTQVLTPFADELWLAWLYHLGYRHATSAVFDAGMAKRYELLTR